MMKVSRKFMLVILVICAPFRLYGQTPEFIEPHDNTTPAGNISDGVLRLALVAEEGLWHPETRANPGLKVRAFREENGPLVNPGPLIRVPEGTRLEISVRNGIPDSTLKVYGLQSRPSSKAQVISVPYGETVETGFLAGSPGTYFYWATTDAPMATRDDKDSQLGGALIVDTRDSKPAGDKVFVLGEWLDPEGRYTAYTINGLVWPHTPRIETTVGEESNWRWINPTRGGHPFHLHGSFFSVVTKGTMLSDTIYSGDDQRTVVTELLPRGSTMTMRWMPEYEGNWLMHCHIASHVSPDKRLAPHTEGHHGNHAEEGMSGMVIGIHAKPAPGLFDHSKTEERKITMLMQRIDGHYGSEPGFAIGFGDQPPVVPGPPLFLRRGETVNIELINRLGESTSVHWHGMELESYYDGVADFSGTGRSITPSIKPGESFNAIFTPPRAGTFIYHTHMDDTRQLQAGLYGAMIITEPDQPFDPDVDKLLVIGLLGFTQPETIGINGVADYEMALKAGRTYRLRVINITANNGAFNVTLTSRDDAESWRPVAEDGAELPASFQQSRPAFRENISVGQAFDFEWMPEAGTYWFEVRRGNGQWMSQSRIRVEP